jgi:peroxiredoxin
VSALAFVLLCSTGMQRPAIGQAAPLPLVPDLQGTVHSLKDYAGPKGLVVFFWAGWSERSIEELRRLNGIQKEIRDHGVGVVAVNVEHEASQPTLAAVKDNVAGLGLTLPIAVDEGLKLFKAYGVVSVPSTAIIDAKGELAYFLAGYSHESRDELFDKIDQLAGVEHARPAAAVVRAAPPAIRRLQLGRTQLAGGRIAAARSSFESAAAADASFADPLAELAALALDEGDQTAAQTWLDKAIAIEASNVPARLELARLQVLRGEVGPARKALEALTSDDPLLPAYLGYVLLADGQAEAARAAFARLAATGVPGAPQDLGTLTALTPADLAQRMVQIRRLVAAKRR